MNFVYFILADAANPSADGKTNILGAGVREVSPQDFPVNVPLAIVGRIEGSPEEAVEHKLRVTVEGPDKNRVVIVDDASVPLGNPKAEEGLTPALNFQIGLMLSFDKAGERTIRATYGNKRASWKFMVNPARASGGTPTRG